MPRPKKDPSLIRGETLRIPVSEDEKRRINAAALATDGEFARWARRILLKAADQHAALADHRSGPKAKRRGADCAADSLIVPLFFGLWERLRDNEKLGSVAYIHRGIEWKPFDEDSCYSAEPKPGFREGFATAENMTAFVAPPTMYLSMRNLKGGSHKHAWGQKKVIANAVRLERVGWRQAAFVDDVGLLATQNFHGIWPKYTGIYTSNVLSAILNSPIASAYMCAHEGHKKHNEIRVLEKLPLPPLDQGSSKTIASLVSDYISLSRGPVEQRRDVLLHIDAAVLRAYALPPRIERQLLDFFDNRRRPVGFDFSRYYPEDFTPSIPLSVYLSKEFKLAEASAFIRTLPQITDPDTVEALLAVE